MGCTEDLKAWDVGGMTCVGFGDDLGVLKGGGCGMGLKERMNGGAKKW